MNINIGDAFQNDEYFYWFIGYPPFPGQDWFNWRTEPVYEWKRKSTGETGEVIIEKSEMAAKQIIRAPEFDR